MGIIRGALGKIDQSVGDVTFSQWKGRNVVKQKVPATNTSNSPAQYEQRTRFAAMGRAAQYLAPLFRIGFNNAATSITQYNIFVKRNFQYVTFNDPDAEVLWDQLVVSSGTVGAPAQVAAAYDNATKKVKVTWEDNSNGADALSSDKAYIGIWDQTTNTLYTSMGTVTRSSGAAGVSINVKSPFSAPASVVYIFFRRATSTATSPSVVSMVN